MRARRLAAAVALPAMLATAAAGGWAGLYAGDGRDEIAELGAQATLGATTTEAISALSQEVIALGGLRALPEPVPQALRPYLDMSSGLPVNGPGGSWQQLLRADTQGAVALERLRDADVELGPELRRALAELPEAERRRARDGVPPASASAADYSEAISELQASFAAAAARTQAAVDQLLEIGEAPPPWRDPGFVGGVLGIWALVAAAAALVARAVSRAVRRAEAGRESERARADGLARRNGRLLQLGDAGRRVSARPDLRGVADAVAAEAAALLGAKAAAVFLLDGERAVPAGAAGDLHHVAVAADAGVLGRALDTGAPARSVADDDPALPGLAPVSALAAPLIADRRLIGAIVVGGPGQALADDEDAQALHLLALAASTAIEGARARARANAMALTDALTGLGNRRRLDQDLRSACDRRHPRPVGLVMVDVDHFKVFNDTHGHPAGDAVLREVAALAAAAVREGDVVYRFGGEELCILLPGARDDEALAVAERVRAAVAAHPFPGGDSQPGGRVTVSAGVAHAADGDGDALLAAADAALYRAKRSGRDRVVAQA